MHNILITWFDRKVAERYADECHECELCGDIDSSSVHEALSTGEVVCWHCAERAGEFEVPQEMEWRVSEPE
jgi:hypothetical protein